MATGRKPPDEELLIARRMAQRLLAGTDMALRSGPPLLDQQGWHFPLRLVSDPDTLYDGHSPVRMVTVLVEELPKPTRKR